jgi:hypothetical protein
MLTENKRSQQAQCKTILILVFSLTLHLRSNKKLIAQSSRQTPKQIVQITAKGMEVNFLKKRQL